MNHNEGLENLKKQLLDFFSLKKEIGRMQFILYSILPLLLLLYILTLTKSIAFQRDLFCSDMYSVISSVISWGLMVAIIASIVCFIIFSMQRLNSLKLNKNIAYLFIAPALLLILINILVPALSQAKSSAFNYEFWNGMYMFFDNITGYFELPGTIVSFICVVLIILLSTLKGINR